MMRKLRILLLAAAAALLCLSGCVQSGAEHGSNELLFYYLDNLKNYDTFGSTDGALGAESRDLADEAVDYVELLNLYFAGPESSHLKSPFPAGLQCVETSLDESVLTVILSEKYDELEGINRTIAAGCIVKTLCQLEGISGICLETERQTSLSGEPKVLTVNDFVCEDLGAINTETTVRLYFSDLNGRYLVTSEQRSYYSNAGEIPTYVMQQLIAGPTDNDQLPTIPEGTELLGLTVESDGTCIVDLSSEFLYNQPDTGFLERMTVLSIVNSLTELEPIKAVRILVEGETVGQYLCMDLDQPLMRDESALDMVREGLNETDATLYVHGCGDGQLAPVPISIRENMDLPVQETLLQELIRFQEINGLTNPLPQGTTFRWANLRGGTCWVDFSRAYLAAAGNYYQEQLAVQSVVATLLSLDQVDAVRISVDGSNEGFRYFSLSHTYTSDDLELS